MSAPSGVLSSTTRDQLGVLLQQLLIETHVLVLREDGIVVLQAVLLEKGGIAKCPNISASISLSHDQYALVHTHEPECLHTIKKASVSLSRSNAQSGIHVPRRGFSKHRRGYPGEAAIMIKVDREKGELRDNKRGERAEGGRMEGQKRQKTWAETGLTNYFT